MQVRERAAAVGSGLTAAGVVVLAGGPVVGALGALALYAGAGYFTTRHPDVVWGRRDQSTGPDWRAGGFAGGLSFGLVGLVAADATPWLLVLSLGFAAFGFTAGVAWARGADGDDSVGRT